MRIDRPPYLMLGVCFVGTIVLAAAGLYSVAFGRSHLETTVESQIEMLESTAEIRHLDEVLTMSAKMYASTSDPAWRERYNEHVAPLDSAIRDLHSYAPLAFDSSFGRTTQDANAALVKMETDAMDLVNLGEPERALELLSSPNYLIFKDQYAKETDQIIRHIHDLYLAQATANQIEHTVMLWIKIVIAPVTILGWLVLLFAMRQYQRSLEHSIQNEIDAHQARHANNAKSMFLANMSHEIRTPMTAILGYAEILENSKDLHDTTFVKDSLSVIRRNSKHLLCVIDDILDLSKIEAGKLEIEHTYTNPIQIIEEVASLVRPKAIEKGLEFNVQYNDPIPTGIQSDPTRIRQILLNLLSNAIKFTDKGHVRLYAGFEHDRSASDQDSETQTGVLTIGVLDSGIGMTKSQLDLITQFDAFQQADSSTTRRFGGSGLGLSISNTLSEKLGGSLVIESEYESGTSIELKLNAELVPGAESCDPSEALRSIDERLDQQNQPKLKPKPLRGLSIIFAEDGIDNQRLISFHLKKAGATVHIVENGDLSLKDTLESIKKGTPYDLVLTDMQMPVLDGYQATECMREKGVRIPIIALTAHAMSHDEQRCLDAGCDAYLSKPVDAPKLIETCAKWAEIGVSPWPNTSSQSDAA